MKKKPPLVNYYFEKIFFGAALIEFDSQQGKKRAAEAAPVRRRNLFLSPLLYSVLAFLTAFARVDMVIAQELIPFRLSSNSKHSLIGILLVFISIGVLDSFELAKFDADRSLTLLPIL